MVVIVTWFLSTGGLPRQCAHWLAMTGNFGHSATNTHLPVCRVRALTKKSLPKRSDHSTQFPRTAPKSPRDVPPQAQYSDSGRPFGAPSRQMPVKLRACMSVYGGLVPLGFSHSRFSRLEHMVSQSEAFGNTLRNRAEARKWCSGYLLS